MSSLTPREQEKMVRLLDMGDGHLLWFSHSQLADFVGRVANLDIHSPKYQAQGASKAKIMRAFWNMEPDDVVGAVLQELIGIRKDAPSSVDEALLQECEDIAQRLVAGGLDLSGIKESADQMDAQGIRRYVARMENAVESDPELAIGTAKDIVESVCKTILEQRGVQLHSPSMSALTKATTKELKLAPEDIPDHAKGVEVIRRILHSLGSIFDGVNELRDRYGTGHGREAHRPRVSPSMARLAVGAAGTLVRFLLETHNEQRGS